MRTTVRVLLLCMAVMAAWPGVTWAVVDYVVYVQPGPVSTLRDAPMYGGGGACVERVLPYFFLGS